MSAAAPERAGDRRGEFRRRLLAGEVLLGTFLNMGSPVSAELCGRAGFDWGLIDLEHGLGSESGLLAELYALEAAGVTGLVRVEEGAPLRLSRALDQGAAGVMVPRIDSAERAAEVVAAMRYPPQGARGVALSARGGGYGTVSHDQLAEINGSIVTLIQIESARAVDAAAAIAAVDGVDGLFVGPNDLTHDMGLPGRFGDEAYRDAVRAAAAAARASGKAAGILLRSAEELDEHVELGYSFFAFGSDSGLLRSAAASAVAELRQRDSARRA